VGCVVLFLAGEVAGRIVPGAAADPWRLPFFACAFGLLNAATLAAINIVTNAVTGHWIAVGVGMADDWPTLLNRQNSHLISTRDDDDSPAAPDGPAGKEPQSGNQKKWQSSMSVAISFLLAIIVTSLLYNECLREVQVTPIGPWLTSLSMDHPWESSLASFTRPCCTGTRCHHPFWKVITPVSTWPISEL
jgi:hypothetical protein